MSGVAVPLLALAVALALWPGGPGCARPEIGGGHAGGRGSGAVVSADAVLVPEAPGGVLYLELLAACLAAGMDTPRAVRAVAPGAPPGTAKALRRAADLMALGAGAARAWEDVARHEDGAGEVVVALARAARRSGRSGTPLGEAVERLAERLRAEGRRARLARAERSGVLVAGPLGLCFLPAFIVLGLVPIVIGLAGDMLGGGH